MTSLMRLHPVARALCTGGGRWPRDWFEDLDDWFRMPFGGVADSRADFGDWAPALRLTESDDAYHVEVDVPGVTKDSIQLNLEGELLTVAGERHAAPPEGTYLRQELPAGAFRHQVRLPGPVAEERVTADYANGVLNVTLPKQADTAPRRIAID